MSQLKTINKYNNEKNGKINLLSTSIGSDIIRQSFLKKMECIVHINYKYKPIELHKKEYYKNLHSTYFAEFR